MARMLVIGAGICGLGTALLLADDGHEVTVVDRDDSPLPERAEDAWNHWSRKGVAQFRQPHNFMPGLCEILAENLPSVLDSLRDQGATRLSLLPRDLPPDPDLAHIDARLSTWTSRRPLGEWVFADRALRSPRIELRRGRRIDGLLTGPSTRPGVPHVIGARTTDGETLLADLVIDATGRGSRAPAWLDAIDARSPTEVSNPCGFRYLTRFFAGAIPELRTPAQVPIGTVSVLTLPGDNDTWSTTLVVSGNDHALKGLAQERAWSACLRACPLHAHWLDGEPLTGVLAMGGIVDRYRSFVVDGVPVATGFAAVADALSCTNPSAGRGMSVGMRHALLLRDAVREGIDDPYGFAVRLQAATDASIRPWYEAQQVADNTRFAQMEALRSDLSPPPPTREASEFGRLMSAMAVDPVLLRAGLEYVACLTPIQEILARDEVQKRIEAAAPALRAQPRASIPGPDRAELLALLD